MNRIQQNKILRTIKVLTVIGLLLATIYMVVLMFSVAQIANERAYCRTTPTDKLSSGELQWCEGLR